VPVTLKIRTGWDRDHRNGVAVARIAEAAGIAALAVHGRTRADLYQGQAEYETIAAIKAAVRIPVIANGDVDSPAKARAVLDATGCDAVMIGRAAQGRPWIFREIAHFLATGETLAPPSPPEIRDILLGHLDELHAFHGEVQGVRIARKHLGWYVRQAEGQDADGRASSAPASASKHSSGAEAFRAVVNRAESAAEQRRLTCDYFDRVAGGRLPRAA
jgi:tRNA-dihydrouridine synthase B